MDLHIRKRQKNYGFSLIELVVVIFIVSLLMGIVAVNISSVRQKGRDGQRKADVAKIRSSLEIYRSDVGAYPTPPLYATSCPTSSPLVSGTTSYLSRLPCDPQGVNYQYCSANTTSYRVRTCLENVNDAQRDIPINPTPPSGCSLTTCPSASYTLENP